MQNKISVAFSSRNEWYIYYQYETMITFSGKVEVICFEIPNGICVTCIKRKTELGGLKLI